MNDQDFVSVTRADATFIQSRLLLQQRLTHGFSNGGFTTDRQLRFARQRHTNVLVNVNDTDSDQFDGFVGDRLARCAVAIRTADCMPVIISADAGFALVHIGWRGLANRAGSAAIRMLGATHCSIAIGPCAGPDRYEIGPDVLEAIGSHVAATAMPGGKALLHMPETLRNELIGANVELEAFHWCEVCTISDARFESHRRDGANSKRNISFVIVE